MVASLSQLPDNLLRRFGGGLVVAGIVIYYVEEIDWLIKSGRICLILDAKSAVTLKSDGRIHFKQTVILKNG